MAKTVKLLNYEIKISSNLSFAKEIKTVVQDRKAVVITNQTIAKLYAKLIKTHFKTYSLIVIPDGEQHKNIQTVATLYDLLSEHKINRKDYLIALGGGVIGDLVGFVAATYLRGIRFIQIPTTLLAQVDSSVGGKTGFNLKAGKNLVGAFYQPAKVLIDPLFIQTLPAKEIRSGMAEIIKYGCILDRSFLNYLSLGLSLGLKLTISRKEFLETIIEKSCQWKAYVVSKDEKENNLRAILNFGHTLGHALEGASGYKGLSHGEWVALGMIFAARLSLKLKKIDQNDVLFLEKMFQNAGYVWHLNKFPFSKIEKYLWQDKKISSSKLTWVIPETRLGKVKITDKISYQLVKQTYLELQKDYK